MGDVQVANEEDENNDFSKVRLLTNRELKQSRQQR